MNLLNTTPSSPSHIAQLGDSARNLAFNALTGHLGLNITFDWKTALDQVAPLYIWSGEHLGDKDGRFWIPALINTADLLNVIKSVAADKGIMPWEAEDRVRRWASGPRKKFCSEAICAAVEIDHLPRDEQERRYAPLTAATGLRWALQVFSGGKSVHAYLSFDKPISAGDPIRLEIQHLLIVILEGDHNIVDASRLLRLPGWDGSVRKQPVLHADASAHYTSEGIRDRLKEYAASLGITDVELALQCLRTAKALDDAANRQSGGEAAHELREHAALLRKTRASPNEDYLTLAAFMLGRKGRSRSAGSVGTGGSWEGGEYRVPMATFAGLQERDRCIPPCCAGHHRETAVYLGGGRAWCHKCGQLVVEDRSKILSDPAIKFGGKVGKQRYLVLGRMELPGGIHVLVADTGTGKTTRLAEIVKEARRRGERVLVIVHRRSLARDAAEAYGLDCYLDLQGDITSDGVVVSMDSLHRYQVDPGAEDDLLDGEAVANRCPDWIIIEESESAFGHLGGGGTIPLVAGKSGRATAREVYLHVETLVRGTVAKGGRVVAADALAGGYTQATLARFAGCDQAALTLRGHRWTADDPEVIGYEKRQDVLAALLEVVADSGKKPIIACTSAGAARRVHHVLAAAGHNGLVLTADESHERWSKRQCVTEGWGDADYVVHSPSIDSGVNFNPEDATERFTDVFIFADSVVGIGWRKLVQMRHRARHHDRVHWWCARSFKHGRPCDEPTVRKEMETRWKSARGWMVRYVPETEGKLKAVKYRDDDFFAFIVASRAHGRTEGADVAAAWCAWWRSRGAEMTAGQVLSKAERRKAANLWTEAGRTIDKRYDDSVLAAEKLTRTEHDHIRRRGARSKDEALALERVRPLNRFGGLRRELAALDRHRERTRQVTRASRAALVCEGDVGKAHEAAMGTDLAAVRKGEAGAVKGASSRVRVAVGLVGGVLGRGWARGLLPPSVRDDPAIQLAHTPSNCSDLKEMTGGVCQQAAPTVEWTASGLAPRLLAIWRRFQDGLADAEVALAGLGLTERDLRDHPTRTMGSLLRYIGLATRHRQPRVDGKRVRVYWVDPDNWDALRADIARTVTRARGESVTAWDKLPDDKPQQLIHMSEPGVRYFDPEDLSACIALLE